MSGLVTSVSHTPSEVIAFKCGLEVMSLSEAAENTHPYIHWDMIEECYQLMLKRQVTVTLPHIGDKDPGTRVIVFLTESPWIVSTNLRECSEHLRSKPVYAILDGIVVQLSRIQQ